MTMWVLILKNLRWCTLITGLSNVVVIILGAILMTLVYPACGHKDILPFTFILFGSCLRIVIMIRAGISQRATATIVLNSSPQSSVLDAVIRHERRVLARFKLLCFFPF
ncbi:hypothetical protein U1Q18_030507 [Sarracenia purpurea var. burkii]